MSKNNLDTNDFGDKDAKPEKDSPDKGCPNNEGGAERENLLSSLRIPQNFGAGFDTTGQITIVRVVKPSKSMFFRSWPDPDKWERFWILTLDCAFEGRETFIVASDVIQPLYEIAPSLMAVKVIVPYIYFEGEVSAWPIRIPKTDGKLDTWNQSAMRLAETSTKKWIRMGSNQEISQYVSFPAQALEDRDPDWGEWTPESIYEQAFKDCSIHSMDDPVVKHLRGVK
jgi:hypothetical protein